MPGPIGSPLFVDRSAGVFLGGIWAKPAGDADQRYSHVRMPTKPTPFLHPNPHELEPLDTVHSRVIFCVGADRFAIDFIGTVTELKPRPAEVIPIRKKSSAKRRRVGSVGTAGLLL